MVSMKSEGLINADVSRPVAPHCQGEGGRTSSSPTDVGALVFFATWYTYPVDRHSATFLLHSSTHSVAFEGCTDSKERAWSRADPFQHNNSFLEIQGVSEL